MLKVMIVDDDVNVRKCLRKLVPWEKLGYGIVAEAGDGIDGIQRFRETNPDVVITDLKMPGMDGEVFCQKIRAISDKVSIIFLSAYERFTAAKISLQYGVTDYILKPLDPQKIEQVIIILKDISNNRQSSRVFFSLINDERLRQEFMEQLRIRNVDYINRFLENMSGYPSKDYVLIHSAACVMLKLLLQVTEESNEKQFKRDEIFAQLDSYTRKMDVTGFVNEIFSEYLQNDSNTDTENNFNNKMIGRIKAYVTENVSNSQLSVASVADYFDFSEDYLGFIFKRYTDTTLISYITHIRLNYACRLLKNTRFPVKDIAQMVGYSNANYFCRVFKKQLGITPNDYRKRL